MPTFTTIISDKSLATFLMKVGPKWGFLKITNPRQELHFWQLHRVKKFNIVGVDCQETTIFKTYFLAF